MRVPVTFTMPQANAVVLALRLRIDAQREALEGVGLDDDGWALLSETRSALEKLQRAIEGFDQRFTGRTPRRAAR